MNTYKHNHKTKQNINAHTHTHTHTYIHARLPGVLLFVSSRPSVAGSCFVSGFFKTNGQDRASRDRDRDRDRDGSGAIERVGLTKDKGNKPLN